MPEPQQDRLPDPPTFARPPLDEVIHAIVLCDALEIGSLECGRIWELLRSSYPNAEMKMPIWPGQPATVDLSRVPPRMWLYDSRDWLLQLQPDRVILNWRAGHRSEYPGYTYMRERLRAERTRLACLLRKQFGIETDLAAAQAELTYIDHIPLSEKGLTWADAHQYLKPLRWDHPNASVLVEATAGIWVQQVALPDERGTLRVQLAHATRDDDGKEFVQTNITAQGPVGRDEDEWFDLAHRYCVWAFCDVTDDDKQRIEWGRQDA